MGQHERRDWSCHEDDSSTGSPDKMADGTTSGARNGDPGHSVLQSGKNSHVQMGHKIGEQNQSAQAQLPVLN